MKLCLRENQKIKLGIKKEIELKLKIETMPEGESQIKLEIKIEIELKLEIETMPEGESHCSSSGSGESREN